VRRGLAVAAGTIAVLALWLRFSGQPWWCRCGLPVPWSWDIWSSHNSQHLLDPYSASHFLHGLLFYALLAPLAKRVKLPDRLAAAAVLEAAWEALENSPIVIERYRAATISLEYSGDSVLNATSDVLACLLGFAFAARFPVNVSIATFAITELLLAVLIRDNLTLNVLMLISPIEAIRDWQAAGR
jgi:hypothetical protein